MIVANAIVNPTPVEMRDTRLRELTQNVQAGVDAFWEGRNEGYPIKGIDIYFLYSVVLICPEVEMRDTRLRELTQNVQAGVDAFWEGRNEGYPIKGIDTFISHSRF